MQEPQSVLAAQVSGGAEHSLGTQDQSVPLQDASSDPVDVPFLQVPVEPHQPQL